MKKYCMLIYIRLLFLIASAVVLVILFYYSAIVGFNFKDKYILNYKTESNIDYKVYLFKNEYFSSNYLDKGHTYISSLIDNIDVNYHYILNYSEFISGEYTYYIKGTICAKKKNGENGDYWTKDYILKEKETRQFTNQNMIVLNENIKVDYQKYNKLLSEFKKNYGLSFDGMFYLTLIIENTSKSDNIDNSINIDTNLELSIPLTQQVIDLTIGLNNDNSEKSVVDEKIIFEKINYIFIGISIITLIVLTIIMISIYKWLKILSKQKSKYSKELKKIISSYGNIIVNVNNMPNIIEKNIIEVSDFSELIDAYSEVRMPINYYEEIKDYKSVFLLISGDIVWIYTLIDKDSKQNNLNAKIGLRKK